MPVPICEQDDSIKLSLRHRDELGFAYFRITFEVDNLHIERIREELEYGGLAFFGEAPTASLSS
jgi:hypothetical protein